MEEMADRNREICTFVAFKKRLESRLLEVVLVTFDPVSEAKDRRNIEKSYISMTLKHKITSYGVKRKHTRKEKTEKKKKNTHTKILLSALVFLYHPFPSSSVSLNPHVL